MTSLYVTGCHLGPPIRTEMVKVMLTTFKHNDPGFKFFQEALKYQIDDISPEDGMYEDECYYWILSKPIRPKKASGVRPAPTEKGAAGVTTNGHVNGTAESVKKGKSEGTTTPGIISDIDRLVCLNDTNLMFSWSDWEAGRKNMQMVKEETCSPQHYLLRNILSLFASSLDTNVAASRLKLASFFVCHNEVERTADVLNDVERRYDDSVQAVRGFGRTDPLDKEHHKPLFTTSIGDNDDVFLTNKTALCVRYLRQEVFCAPPILCFEMYLDELGCCGRPPIPLLPAVHDVSRSRSAWKTTTSIQELTKLLLDNNLSPPSLPRGDVCQPVEALPGDEI
ncbi:NAA40-like protein [Mya arenaria]|uniref:NAA40-like protein n=1 Tax=Mya arenaria TaxID=6604 RepID=A0ABY7FAM8_MYAAR|nr:NAA40-like protein [Mya arenaria]